jgi:hypothetical protein
LETDNDTAVATSDYSSPAMDPYSTQYNSRVLLRCGVVLGVTAGLLLAQTGSGDPVAKPNLSGTWKLNLQRSGPILPRGTMALTMKIEHREPMMRSRETRVVSGKVTTSKDPWTAIDCKEHESKHPGKTVLSSACWSGRALKTHNVTTIDGVDYISDIATTLSDDGKVLTMAEHYREPGLERIRDWVFEKQ